MHGQLEEGGRHWAELFRPLLEETPRERPWTWCKVASSLDGRIATRGGDARWVTSELARKRGRRIRSRVDGIMVGVGTVLADDPLLTARCPGREPRRIVLDSRGRTPTEARLLRTTGGTVTLFVGPAAPEAWRERMRSAGADVMEVPSDPRGRLALASVLALLRAQGCRSLLVEGGGTLHGALFDEGLVDYVHWFIAPRIIGGREALGAVQGLGQPRLVDAPRLEELRIEALGTDLFVSGRVSA
ncbi:MAG: RibD family protein [Myxococcota bacterium]